MVQKKSLITIEQKCNAAMEEFYMNKKIEDWKWNDKWNSEGFSGYQHVGAEVICHLIEDADESECLTSPAPYIREYKKWIKNHIHVHKSRYVKKKAKKIIERLTKMIEENE